MRRRLVILPAAALLVTVAFSTFAHGWGCGYLALLTIPVPLPGEEGTRLPRTGGEQGLSPSGATGPRHFWVPEALSY